MVARGAEGGADSGADWAMGKSTAIAPTRVDRESHASVNPPVLTTRVAPKVGKSKGARGSSRTAGALTGALAGGCECGGAGWGATGGTGGDMGGREGEGAAGKLGGHIGSGAVMVGGVGKTGRRSGQLLPASGMCTTAAGP